MAKITIEADTPEQLLGFVRNWLNGSGSPTVAGGDAAKIMAVVRRMYGPLARRFLREVAEAGIRGETVTLVDGFALRYGLKDNRQLGGAIGNVAASLAKALGRPVADRIGRSPAVWRMTADDAKVVLAALDERQA